MESGGIDLLGVEIKQMLLEDLICGLVCFTKVLQDLKKEQIYHLYSSLTLGPYGTHLIINLKIHTLDGFTVKSHTRRTQLIHSNENQV